MNDTYRPRLIRRQTTRQVADTAIVLETVGLEVRAPFGGFVWHRPAAVVARSPGAAETRLPIPDLTRRGQLILYGIALLFALAGLMARGRAIQETTP